MIKYLSLLIATVTCCEAAQNYRVKNNGLIKARISARDVNRIYIEGDRINGVHGNLSELEISSNSANGQLFIKPTNENLLKTHGIVLTTEEGKVVDMLLTTMPNAPMETIKINFYTNQPKPKKLTIKQQAKSLITAMINNVGLKDYWCSLKSQDHPEFAPLQVTQIKRFDGEKLRGYVFEIKNPNRRGSIQLKDGNFKNIVPQIMALNVDQPVLKKKESTYMYVVARR